LLFRFIHLEPALDLNVEAALLALEQVVVMAGLGRRQGVVPNQEERVARERLRLHAVGGKVWLVGWLVGWLGIGW
jgi:hypothetical protein